MKVVTAPEEYRESDDDIKVFLAGGITDCHDWQSSVIEELEKLIKECKADNLVIFNPRRPRFPIGDSREASRQITWEYNALQKSEIFSMYFCKGKSDQPICMYELGRNLLKIIIEERFGFTVGAINRIVVSVEDGYKRDNDVVIQSRLAFSGQCDFVHLFATPKNHAKAIIEKYKIIQKQRRIVKIADLSSVEGA